MSLWSSWTPCDEVRPCHYNTYMGKRKGCNVLKANPDGSAPFVNGKCPFWKPPKKEKP